jgi:hypothetical protein
MMGNIAKALPILFKLDFFLAISYFSEAGRERIAGTLYHIPTTDKYVEYVPNIGVEVYDG